MPLIPGQSRITTEKMAQDCLQLWSCQSWADRSIDPELLLVLLSEPSGRNKMRTSSQAQEARQAASSPSATKGAVYLILTQVVSRGFTFLANQILLRQVSPGVFGAAAQLELFSISILFFSRESVRVSLQRRPPIAPAWEKAEDDDNGTSNDRRKSSTRGRRGVLQEAVNIAWLPVILGTILVLLLGVSYNHVMRHVSSITPYFTLSLKIVGFGCMIELLAEPCFAIVQARGGFKTRAKVESAAAISKCAGACSTAVVAAKAGMVDDPGVLPFAAGLFAYSTTILVGYLVHTIPLRKKESFSLFPLPIFDTLVRYPLPSSCLLINRSAVVADY